MTVVLRPMTEQEFAERNTVLVDRYADNLRESGRVSAAEAHDESVRQNSGFLPQGLDTPGMLLFMAEADDQPVGWLWVGPTIKADLPEQAGSTTSRSTRNTEARGTAGPCSRRSSANSATMATPSSA